MLAANVGKPEGSKFIYEGYKVNVFPDSLDTGANIDIGYVSQTRTGCCPPPEVF